MSKHTFFIGFMLFALFFGAGNLIYPPTLGMEAGTSYWSTMGGFIITGVGLPILAVMAISFVKEDTRELANRVSPVFGLIFATIVYLAIGPFFGIPRAATTAYEMSIIPFIDVSALTLFIFTAIFFCFVYIVSLNPSKMVDRIGQILTPILFIAVLCLIIGGFFLLKQPLSNPQEPYQNTPFFKGFIEGYLTMDAIAALAFGIIVVNAFKARGITTQRSLVKATLKVGMITSVALVTVYASLGWIGAKMAAHGNYTNGGEILSAAAHAMFGQVGALLLGIIVTLACFTTCVGLIVAAGQFFTKITKLSYHSIILIVTIISFVISNQGLETIIDYSIPVLVFIYPIAIVLIILPFFYQRFGQLKGIYRGAVLFTGMISLFDGLSEYGINMSSVTVILEKLPFFNLNLGWLIPAIIGGALGGGIEIMIAKNTSRTNNQ